MRHSPTGALTALVLALGVPTLRAQGTFTNFETPQTHPIEVADIGGVEHVLVCNTPDNALEVWTATATPVQRARISVGLGPCSVRWNATLKQAFVCNFDGDSVSIVSLQMSGTTLSTALVLTAFVGDEPADIAFNPSAAVAMVTLSGRSSMAWFNTNGLTPFGAPVRLDVPMNQNNGMYPNLVANFGMAVKAPRACAWLANDRILILNFMGDQDIANSSAFYDVDLLRFDAPFTAGTQDYIGKLGTTNHAFVAKSDGSQLFVVGTKAQNLVNPGLASVNAAPTGFVQSWLSVVNVPTTGNISLQGEAPTGGPPGVGVLPSVNLNRDYTVSGSTAELPASSGISQPTDVDLFEQNNVVQQIAIAGFHSDNVALLTPSNITGGYVRQLVPLSTTSGTTYTVVGPRGVAFNAAGTLLFTNGRLDNSLRVINTSSLAVTTVQLQDPTPVNIRAGRQFLYSTRFSRTLNANSTSGFVSCASCHVDGRTDALVWDLSAPDNTPPGPSISPWLNDSTLLGGTTGFPFASFPPQKGPMVTQTLQGLVNFETNEQFQFLATNAPYHWRGDKNDFTDFNEAFVNLQRMPLQPGTQPGPTAKGLTNQQMVDYRRFVNTIRHPSNPEENVDRLLTGSVGSNPNSTNPTAATGFTGQLMGRVMFHNFSIVAPRSCVDCHSLPDASSNTLVLSEIGPSGVQPFESAALRNVFAREGQSHTDTKANPLILVNNVPTAQGFPGTVFLSNTGLRHDAQLLDSINTFIGAFAPFMPSIPASPAVPTAQNLADAREQLTSLVQFARVIDTGMAPASGFAFTLNPNNPAGNAGAFNALEAQVNQANIGLGVQIHRNGTQVLGFWFDPTAGYRDATSSSPPALSRTAMLALVQTGDLVILQGTPLGTERRWANPSGIGVTLANTNAPPSNVAIEKMAPMTFDVGTTALTGNLPASPALGTTRWRILQFQNANLGSFGLPAALRHEPPRRFRVSGDNIRAGATLFLFMPDGTLNSNNQPNGFPIGMQLALYPTGLVNANNRPIWESELELDELQTLVFLCGGPLAPGVLQILHQDLVTNPSPPGLNPGLFNSYAALVVNEDGTLGLSPVAPMQVQDIR